MEGRKEVRGVRNSTQSKGMKTYLNLVLLRHSSSWREGGRGRGIRRRSSTRSSGRGRLVSRSRGRSYAWDILGSVKRGDGGFRLHQGHRLRVNWRRREAGGERGRWEMREGEEGGGKRKEEGEERGKKKKE